MLIDLIADNRSTCLTIAPVIYAIRQEQLTGIDIRYRLIYTDKADESFFSFCELLNIPKPDNFLDVSEGASIGKSALVMTRYEKILAEKKPDIVFVTGNSTAAMAISIVAKNYAIMLAHYDAGLRIDTSSVENVNGKITDAICDYYFTTSHTANENLRNNGVKEEQIFFTGNMLADMRDIWEASYTAPRFWEKLQLQKSAYFILRFANKEIMQHAERLRNVLVPIIQSSKGIPLIMIVDNEHAEMAKEIGMRATNLFLVQPLHYFNYCYLIKNALAVITDIDMLQMESTILNVPCMTISDECMHPETCYYGSNELIGYDERILIAAFKLLYSGKWAKDNLPYMWDGKSAMRIMNTLKQLN